MKRNFSDLFEGIDDVLALVRSGNAALIDGFFKDDCSFDWYEQYLLNEPGMESAREIFVKKGCSFDESIAPYQVFRKTASEELLAIYDRKVGLSEKEWAALEFDPEAILDEDYKLLEKIAAGEFEFEYTVEDLFWKIAADEDLQDVLFETKNMALIAGFFKCGCVPHWSREEYLNKEPMLSARDIFIKKGNKFDENEDSYVTFLKTAPEELLDIYTGRARVSEEELAALEFDPASISAEDLALLKSIVEGTYEASNVSEENAE